MTASAYVSYLEVNFGSILSICTFFFLQVLTFPLNGFFKGKSMSHLNK